MIARRIQKGNSIDYTPGADVSAGDVIVQGELAGVAPIDIPANTQGAIQVEGVFDFPKAAGGGTGIAVGAPVYWDAGEDEAVDDADSGANKLLGKAILAAADADTTVRVRLSQ